MWDCETHTYFTKEIDDFKEWSKNATRNAGVDTIYVRDDDATTIPNDEFKCVIVVPSTTTKRKFPTINDAMNDLFDEWKKDHYEGEDTEEWSEVDDFVRKGIDVVDDATLKQLFPTTWSNESTTTRWSCDEGKCFLQEAFRNTSSWSKKIPKEFLKIDDVDFSNFPTSASYYKSWCERKPPRDVTEENLNVATKYVEDFRKCTLKIEPFFTQFDVCETIMKEFEDARRLTTVTTTTNDTLTRLCEARKNVRIVSNLRERLDWRILGWFDVMKRRHKGSMRCIYDDDETSSRWKLKQAIPSVTVNKKRNYVGFEIDEKILWITGDNDVGKTTLARTLGTFTIMRNLGIGCPAMEFETPIRSDDDLRYVFASRNRIVDDNERATKWDFVIIDDALSCKEARERIARDFPHAKCVVGVVHECEEKGIVVERYDERTEITIIEPKNDDIFVVDNNDDY